jgi:dienelactone hydrolase
VVPVRVRVPTHPTGPCPVIVFSHGLGGSREGYWLLTEEWASAGFTVIQPSHPGSDTATLKEAGLLGAKDAMRAAVADPAVLTGRPRLMSRLIDLLPEIRAKLPEWNGAFDAARIGVAGHSFGAWTTQAVAGVRFAVPGHPESFADPRPRAFIAMSPNGPSPLQPPGAWDAATRPMLLMTGTEDRMPSFLQRGAEDRGPEWRQKAFTALPPGDKFLAVIDGGHHCAFSNGQGARLSGEPQPEPWIAPMLAATTIAWWRAWLMEDAVALAAVRGGTAVPEADRARVRWESR